MDVTLPLVRTRLAAHILDVLLIGVVGLAIGWAISRLVQQGPPAGPDPANPGRLPPLVDTAIWLLLDAGYFLYTWHARGRTLRMRALGLWVADAADGRRLSYRQGAIRWAVVNLETLVAIALGLVVSLGFAETIAAWAWLLVLLGSTARSAANQGLHDRAAGSIVTAGSPGRLGAGALQPRRRTGAPSAPGTTAPSRMWSRERGALVGALTSTPLCLLLLGLALIRSTEGTPWDSLTLVAFVALTAGPGAGALFAPGGLAPGLAAPAAARGARGGRHRRRHRRAAGHGPRLGRGHGDRGARDGTARGVGRWWLRPARPVRVSRCWCWRSPTPSCGPG